MIDERQQISETDFAAVGAGIGGLPEKTEAPSESWRSWRYG